MAKPLSGGGGAEKYTQLKTIEIEIIRINDIMCDTKRYAARTYS